MVRPDEPQGMVEVIHEDIEARLVPGVRTLREAAPRRPEVQDLRVDRRKRRIHEGGCKVDLHHAAGPGDRSDHLIAQVSTMG